MELSVREAATLLGVSPRTVRARIARGDLLAVRDGATWRLDDRDLPLSATDRRRLQARADAVRRTVDAALPSRAARGRRDRGRSVADLDAFRLAMTVWQQLRGAPERVADDSLRLAAMAHLAAGLDALAEALHHFARPHKLHALDVARTSFARAVAVLLRAAGDLAGSPLLEPIATLEAEVLPAVAGLARWAERLPEHPR